MSASLGARTLCRQARTRALRRVRVPSSHRLLSGTPAPASSAPRRSSNFSDGYTSQIDLPEDGGGRGPMWEDPKPPPLSFAPADLKKRLDEYVVGQERAKRILATALFNHAQIVKREMEHEHDLFNLREKRRRQEMSRPRDAELRGDYHRSDFAPRDQARDFDPSSFKLREDEDRDWTKIKKSNMLVMGPTGSGKTYVMEVATKVLGIPMVTVDCTSLTQTGYVGKDVETCVQRLLIEAQYDIRRAESGVVVFDEFDKLAKRRDTASGRDIAGEGVQQEQLKLIEGTKVIVTVKDHPPNSRLTAQSNAPFAPSVPSPTAPTTAVQAPPSAAKEQQYVVNTENILFIFCGAFADMNKSIKNRVAKSTMGFASPSSATAAAAAALAEPPAVAWQISRPANDPARESYLDLATPEDLQGYGFIPELIGRIASYCALDPVSPDDLYLILTGPRNNLVAQFKAQFKTYPSNLEFTEKALRAIARRAAKNKTGARGLRMEMNRVLEDAMYHSSPYVLVTRASVEDPSKVVFRSKGCGIEVKQMIADEDHEPSCSPAERVEEAQQGTG